MVFPPDASFVCLFANLLTPDEASKKVASDLGLGGVFAGCSGFPPPVTIGQSPTKPQYGRNSDENQNSKIP